ncbi:hypothetical protein [Nostoc sp. 106C]|uniref:hypothetical protein n=1 Tax=Nostoc sp. 106C TaxID=1932667 RepID=UPI000A3CBD58|nr:hypothetical protein [Nostoc sp. 106C]OUL34093.1 hypothetical protein BV375_05285 [Nostoc sp. 106C]
MTREQEIKAAIVVTPDAISFASPEMNQASEMAAEQLGKLVDWIQSKFPFLLRHEAVFFAAAIIEAMPTLLEQNPEAIHSLQHDALMMASRR